MQLSVYVPVLVSALLALGSRYVARRSAPAIAALALSASAAAVGLASAWTALLLALPKALQEPVVAESGEVHRRTLAALDPVPQLSSTLGGVLLVCALGTVALTLVQRRRQLGTLRGLARCGHAAGDLRLLAIDQPVALALPGREASVLLSRGLLRALDDDERRVVLAHERAHLRHRHDRYRLACALAAAANPLLRGMRGEVEFALERWADEDAAVVAGSRALAARALARAALISEPVAGASGALAFQRLRVRERVLALQANPPRRRVGALLACAVLAVIGAAAAVDATAALAQILIAAHS